MIHPFFFTLTAILVVSSASAQDIVARAEANGIRTSDEKVIPRVERDHDGNVISLSLNGMQLSSADVEELGHLEYLRRLVLFRTNFTDDDLAKLKRCKRLESLNLTSTEVSDEAIDFILEFKRLKYVCLGDVNMTPKAIDKLKERNRTSDQDLRWGYSQRKR